MELKDTIQQMTSPDYKERFKAEYAQLKIRIEKLNNFIDRIETAQTKGEQEPKHDCPLAVLQGQEYAMRAYLEILENRAFLENITLESKDGHCVKIETEEQAIENADFETLAQAAKRYAQKHTHPHITIIIDQRGIEVCEGIKARSFELLD